LTGPAGTAGTAGADGATGPAGPPGMSNVQVIEAESLSDSITPIKFANAVCPVGKIAIAGGGAVEMAGSVNNEDIGIDVLGPIDAAGNLPGNAGWRAQATNFFVDSGVNWSVRVFAICATVQ